jgi:predicted nucleic acid-binding protein
MIYADTSVLVAALTEEGQTARARTWLLEREIGEVTISDWVVTEFSAALSVKIRTRQIAPEHRTNALSSFNRLISESLASLPISGKHFQSAAQLADQYSLGLRAGDALHLAIAADHGATLCTLDRRLAEAGPVLGVKTLLL